MTITLTPELEALIQEKVASGDYPDAVDVVGEALRLLDHRDRLARLRASLLEAEREIERGEGVEWSPSLMADLRRDADALYRRGATPDPDVCP